jgi:hypothetical protein
LKKTPLQKRTGRVAQGAGPEFKPSPEKELRKKEKRKRQESPPIA